ncbi:hypothetical protein V8G54_012842 [Vigna mungo]|uniref:Uncharacterized protein n=1 Tax=Vigna mungo TaxID=3915 RepID=A0AAQ3NUJ4_VIGMU
MVNVQRMMSESCDWRDTNNSRHLISVSSNFFGRTTSTSTVPSATVVRFSTSFTSCCTSIRPVALSWLCLIEYLGDHKLSLFLFFMLPQMVLVHHPVGFFWLSVLSKVGVKYKNFLATLLFSIHHHWSGLTSLVPPGFSTLQVTFVLNLSPLSCPSCVSLGGSMEEVPAQSISCYSWKFLWMGITNSVFSFNSGNELIYQRV